MIFGFCIAFYFLIGSIVGYLAFAFMDGTKFRLWLALGVVVFWPLFLILPIMIFAALVRSGGIR